MEFGDNLLISLKNYYNGKFSIRIMMVDCGWAILYNHNLAKFKYYVIII